MKKNLATAFLDKVPGDVADGILVEQAAAAMAEKLEKKRKEGAGGWHTSECSTDDLMGKLLAAVEAGDMVDVLNYAAMIHVRNDLYGS